MNTRSAMPRRPGRAQPTAAPITAHRLFPAIIALWFAALFGIGSLAIAPDQLSALVSALGIPKLIAAAAPPLGFTARVLLATLMAGIGVIVGLLIGSRIAHNQTAKPQRRTDPTHGRQQRPTRNDAYNPAEYPEEKDAPEAEPDRARRSPLRASEAFADIEPLTSAGENQQDPRSAKRQAPSYEGLANASLSERDFACLGAPRSEAYREPDPSFEPGETFHDAFEAFPALAAAEALSLTEPLSPAEPFAPPAPFSTLGDAHEPSEFHTNEHSRFGTYHDGEQNVGFGTDSSHAPDGPPDTISAPAGIAGTIRFPFDPDVRRTLGQAPLDSLGTVQLVERLALAMASAAPTLAAGAPLELDTIAHSQPDAPPPAAHEMWSAPDFIGSRSRGLTGNPDFGVDRPTRSAAPTASAGLRPSILDPIAYAWDDEAAEDDDLPIVAPPRFLSERAAMSDEPVTLLSQRTLAASDDRPMFGGRTAHQKAESDAALSPTHGEAGFEADEDRYPSLLDIQPSQRETIQVSAQISADISAPQPAQDLDARQAEPIVMFPNARAEAPFAPPPTSTLQSRRTPLFQPPVGAGVPVRAPELLADPVDANEADRALRAALATLQRMSGGR